MLQHIAADTDGKYYRATSADSLQKVFTDLESLHHGEARTTVHHTYTPYARPFAIVLAISVLLLILLTVRWERRGFALPSARIHRRHVIMRDVFAIMASVLIGWSIT